MIDVQVLIGSQVRDTEGRLGRIQDVSLPWVRFAWTEEGRISVAEEVYARSDPRLWDSFEIKTLGGWASVGSILGARKRPRGRIRMEDVQSIVFESSEDLEEPVETEVRYCKESGEKPRAKIFASQEEASRFVDTLVEEGCEEILWKSEGEEEYWELNEEVFLGLFDTALEECAACEEVWIAYLQEQRSSRMSLARRRKKRSPGHNPFKYKAKLGPGPRQGRNKKTGKWTCTRSGKYTQRCKHSSGYTKTVRIDPGYKTAYNQEYRKWRAAKTAKYRDAAKKGHQRRKEASGG